MQRYEGIHFYINIKNFNSIILDEEEKYNTVDRSIHALDTFFSSIERFGKKNYKETFTVEKITGSRLHLFVIDEIAEAFKTVMAVSVFAYKLSTIINKEVGKYRNLKDFFIHVGAAFGEFYDFEFEADNYSEKTTIGYAANFAAKIQALTPTGEIGISEEIFNGLLREEKDLFVKVEEKAIEKYGQNCYYTSALSQLVSPLEITQGDFDDVKKYANDVDLYEICYKGVRKPLDFAELSKKDCKKLDGIPLYADIRKFTIKFDPAGENLDEMAIKTQNVLTSMYSVTTRFGGIHVQFQGDRELSLYHDIPGEDGATCFKPAVLAAMRMIDAVKPLKLNIGVGADYGRLFATRIGARGAKDNILLGETVIKADYMEDKCADADQIAITRDVYEALEKEDSTIACQFKKIREGIYIATIGYKEYLSRRETARLQTNTKQNSYNGAWRTLF